MAFGTVSDPLLALALWTGAGALAATAALLLAIVAFRLRLLGRLARERRCAALWNPLLAQCAERVPEPLPPLPRRDAEPFLVLWCRAQESLRGEAQQHLREMARRLGIERHAFRLLESRNLGSQLLALVAFGHLRTEALAPLLQDLIPAATPVVSLTAAKALLRIDPALGVPLLLQQTARREDWPLASVASILQECDAQIVGPLLASAVRAELAANGVGLPRLLRLHVRAHGETLRPAVLEVLEGSASPEALAAALGALWHPQDIGHVRRLLCHEQGFVRVAAVRACSRIGGAAEGAALEAALADPSWWVRYRAAQALCALPGMDPAALGALAARLTDRFAGDILRQALAERTAT